MKTNLKPVQNYTDIQRTCKFTEATSQQDRLITEMAVKKPTQAIPVYDNKSQASKCCVVEASII